MQTCATDICSTADDLLSVRINIWHDIWFTVLMNIVADIVVFSIIHSCDSITFAVIVCAVVCVYGSDMSETAKQHETSTVLCHS